MRAALRLAAALVLPAATTFAAPIATPIPTPIPTSTCVQEDLLLPEATLVLTKAELDRQGYFVGSFQFRNIDLAPALHIAGEGGPGPFTVYRPHARVEFKDLNGTWTELSVGIEHYLPATQRLRVAASSSASIRAVLFPKAVIARDGSDFRLVLHFAGTRTCVVSRVFSVHRVRGEASGLVSAPPPAMPGPRPASSGSGKPHSSGG